jgi:hypothetical protein
METMKNLAPLMILLLGFVVIAGCRRLPDDVQVQQTIDAIAKATEAGSANEATASLSEDFDGNNGELDRRSLSNLIRLASIGGAHVGVTMGPLKIEHRGERIVASFTVTLTSGGKWMPDQMGVYRVESAWRKQGRTWFCYTASWTHAM